MALSPASVSGPCRSPPPTAGSGASAPTCFLRPRSGVAARFSRRFSKRNEEVHITSPGAALLETVQASNSLSYSVSYFCHTNCHTDCHTPVIQIVIQVVILLFASRYAKRKLLSHALSYPNLNVICNARIRPQPIPRHVQPRSAAGIKNKAPSDPNPTGTSLPRRLERSALFLYFTRKHQPVNVKSECYGSAPSYSEKCTG